MIRRFRRCGHAPGALSPEEFRALLAALRDTEFWTPGGGQDIAVRVGPFVERARTRPGDDPPDLIAVALVHPDTPHAAAYLHGHQLAYTGKGWRFDAEGVSREEEARKLLETEEFGVLIVGAGVEPDSRAAIKEFAAEHRVRRVIDGALTEPFDAYVQWEFEPLIRDASKG